MVRLRHLVLVALSFATFGHATAVHQPLDRSAQSTQPSLSLLSNDPGHAQQAAPSALLLGRTNGEEYPPWFHALKKRPFDEFGAPEWAAGPSEPKRQKVIPHPAPLRTIMPSNKFPPLHPDEPRDLPGTWDGEIQYKKPVPSGPKVYRGEPYRKKKTKKATWPTPWSAAFGRRWRPGKKQFPVKHAKSYKSYQTKLHMVQNGGVRKPKLKPMKKLHFSKVRDAVASKLRRQRPPSGVSIQELEPRGGTFSSMNLPFKKRPRHRWSTGSTSSAHSTYGSLTSSASSTPTSYATALSTTPFRGQAAIPLAPLRTFPPSANRPPVHPNTPLLLARVRWDKQWHDQLKQQHALHRSFEERTTGSPSAPSGSGKKSKASSKQRVPVKLSSSKKSKGLFGGRQNSRLQRKNVLRLWKRGSSAVESRRAALSIASDRVEGPATPAVQHELLPRLFAPDPPSPKDKPSSSMFTPSPTPSPPRMATTAEAERLAAQLATLRHTSPPVPASVPRLQRATAMPQRWDASTEALLTSLGKEPSKQPSSRPASSSSHVGPQTAIPGVRGDRIMPPSMRERVKQAWVARFRREKRNKKLQDGQLTEKRKKRGPRIGEKLFPAAHPKSYKGFRNIFHSVLGGRISKFKNGW